MWIYIYIIIFKEAEASIRALIEEIAQFLHFRTACNAGMEQLYSSFLGSVTCENWLSWFIKVI